MVSKIKPTGQEFPDMAVQYKEGNETWREGIVNQDIQLCRSICPHTSDDKLKDCWNSWACSIYWQEYYSRHKDEEVAYWMDRKCATSGCYSYRMTWSVYCEKCMCGGPRQLPEQAIKLLKKVGR
jgi:hypothetical protein